ncbi:uncharacterized protein LOC135228487 [Loxodonta africana]|uniref:uncharacterized protein LOC135228487 n=1 Tax=Loxodonta africana TaxID=9785 RepID=UPI0030D3C5CA
MPPPGLTGRARSAFSEEGALLRFYGSTADHVENNNSLVRSQRQLVLLRAPSLAAGFPDRASPAPLLGQRCTRDEARGRGAAERRPAPREGSAKGNGVEHPRLRERERRGAPHLDTNSAVLEGGPTTRSLAALSQKYATDTGALAGPRGPRPARKARFNLSQLTQGTPSRGRLEQCGALGHLRGGSPPNPKRLKDGRRPSAVRPGSCYTSGDLAATSGMGDDPDIS